MRKEVHYKKINNAYGNIAYSLHDAFSLFGCEDNNEEPFEEAPTEASENNFTDNSTDKSTAKTTVKKTDDTAFKARMVKFTTDIDKFKTLGRTSMADLGLACDFVGSEVEFTGVIKGRVNIKVQTVEKSTDCPHILPCI